MKNLIFICVFCVFLSCDNSLQDGVIPDSILNEKVEVLETTNEISKLFFNMGVAEIVVNQTNGVISYVSNTHKGFILNWEHVDLSDYVVYVKDGVLRMKGVDEHLVTITVDGDVYIKTPGYDGLLSNVSNFEVLDIKANVLLLYLSEITMSQEFKKTIDTYMIESKASGPCKFWDMYYVYATGTSRSVAHQNLIYEVQRYLNNNTLYECRPYGSPDVSCVLENHMCIATLGVCCDGSGTEPWP